MRNSAPASKRNELPFVRSNSNSTGRWPGELARISRTSRNSFPVAAGENRKITAGSWHVSVAVAFAPLGFPDASVFIS